MAVTEEQAKEKWCPHMRMVAITKKEGSVRSINSPSFNIVSVNEEMVVPDACKCLGIGCMRFEPVEPKPPEYIQLYTCGLGSEYVPAELPLEDSIERDDSNVLNLVSIMPEQSGGVNAILINSKPYVVSDKCIKCLG